MLTSNLGDLLRRRSLRNPTIEAVVDLGTGQRLDYRQLNARVNQASNALLALGLEPGERIGLLAATCSEFVETYYASAKIGTWSPLVRSRPCSADPCRNPREYA